MITHHKVDGYENLLKLMKILDCKGSIILYFSGSPNPAGESWCPDCVQSGPVIENVLNQNEHRTFHFIHVGIGTRDEWKDRECPFRTDGKIKLREIPTLILWRTVKRLTGRECINSDNIQMLIDEIN